MKMVTQQILQYVKLNTIKFICIFVLIPFICKSQFKNEEYFINYYTVNYPNLHPLEGIYDVSLKVDTPNIYCKQCEYPDLLIENFSRIAIYNDGGELKIFSITNHSNIGTVEIGNNYQFKPSYYSKNYLSSNSWISLITTSGKVLNFSQYFFCTEYKDVFNIFEYSISSKLGINCKSDGFFCYALDITYDYKRIFPIEDIIPPPKSTSGTGFFINENSTIITNYHVVFYKKKYGDNQYHDIRVNILGDTTNYFAQVFKYDKNLDIAVLKIVEGFRPPYPITYLPINKTDLELGDDASTIGFPFGLITGSSAKFTKGYISSLQGIDDDTTSYTMDLSINPGNSGGPLLDNNGFIRGIVNARLNDDAIGEKVENISYSIKSRTLSKFLTENKIKYYIDANSIKNFNPSLSSVKKSVVFIKCNE
jgi:S1-C subfamily serine protease